MRCVHCSSSPETPGLIGLNRDGEPVCSTHLMLECEQLSYGLRILKLVASVYDRWPGGPPRKHRIPEYWDSPHYLGP